MRLSRAGINRVGAAIAFTFDGQRIEALAGESIASALAANGRLALREARPAGATLAADMRGLYCGMGACFECVVTVDGKAGQRACLTQVEGGETVRSTLPSGKSDDPLQPLVPLPKQLSLPERPVDVLVIGAGPAGLSAALAARKAGAGVVILDERSESGGQYFKPIAASHAAATPIDGQFRDGAALLSAAHEAGIEIVQNASVFGAFSPDEVPALIDRAVTVFRPHRLILATGAFERAMPIPGWTLPGVMTTGAMQTLARSYQIAPGKRVVVAGNGPLNFQLAADLAAHGVDVLALVESAKRPRVQGFVPCIRALAADPANMALGLRYLFQLKKGGVPVSWSSMVVAAHGTSHVEAIDVAPIDSDGRPDMSLSRQLAVDAVALGYGFIASTEIARALGCRMRGDPRHLGSLAVETSMSGATSIEGVFAVGDGAEVRGSAAAMAKGQLAGSAAAAELGSKPRRHHDLADVQRRFGRANAFQDALWTLFKAPPVSLDHLPDETMICRCENLHMGIVKKEIASGAGSLAVLKRRLRLGMGRCQGRYCLPVVSHLMTKMDNAPPPGTAPRLPVKPFPAAAFAIEKSEWGGHQRAGSPDLSRPTPLPPFGRTGADNVIIGGGVVGACLAHELASLGEDVLVVERDDVNLQASGANAGSLHVQLLSFDFGAKAEAGGGPAAATLPLGPWAVSLWQELAELCDHDFEIRITGGLMVAESEAGLKFLRDKAALEKRHGLEVEILNRHDLHELAPALAETLIGAEYSPAEGKINPLTATYSVMHRAESLGARVERSTDVLSIEPAHQGWQLETSRGRIRARRVINAAGPWARNVGAMVGIDLPVYSAPLQMIVTDPAPPLVEQLVAHADRHLSLKQLASGGLVIGGAWSARYSESRNLNVTIRDSIEGNLWVANRVLPQLSGLHILRSWAGMNVNIDGAPIIGEAPSIPSFYNAVTSNGYTLAPAVARLTADLICRGRTDIDVHPYCLERFDGKRP